MFLKFCVQDFKERFDVATNGIQCLKRMLATCPRYPQKVRVTEEKRWRTNCFFFIKNVPTTFCETRPRNVSSNRMYLILADQMIRVRKNATSLQYRSGETTLTLLP